MTSQISNRVCNALALLQCIASHNDTKMLLIMSKIPLFLFPFLNTVSKQRPFEYLRLTSLGVIGALIKIDDPEIVKFLISTEVIPLCLRIMETGTELSKTVATFIVQKILLDDLGLSYITSKTEIFYAILNVLNNMINEILVNPSQRLLKHIIRCYFRLSEFKNAKEILKKYLPEPLKKPEFTMNPSIEESVQNWHQNLLINLEILPSSFPLPHQINEISNTPTTAASIVGGAAPIPKSWNN